MKKEKVIKILRNLDEKSKMPLIEELEIDKQEYGDLIDAMLDEKLISGMKPIRGGIGSKVQMLHLDSYKISIRGMDYLEQNSNNTGEIINTNGW
jgi:hypothetical protein